MGRKRKIPGDYGYWDDVSPLEQPIFSTYSLLPYSTVPFKNSLFKRVHIPPIIFTVFPDIAAKLTFIIPSSRRSHGPPSLVVVGKHSRLKLAVDI